MTKKMARPENSPWVTPYIIVHDVDKAVRFYEQAFRFEKLNASQGEDNSTWHAETRYQDQWIMFGKAGAHEGKSLPPNQSKTESPITLYLYCEDVDAFYKHAVQAGAKSLSAPEDTFWHDRMCRLQDPDGYTWIFATPLQEE